LEVGAAGDGDNLDHSFSAFRAACCLIHEMILPIFPPYGSSVPWWRGNQIAIFVSYRNLRGEVCFGSIQASVTALSITCRWTLLHSGQLNVRKSWPGELGSIAVSFIGEPQAVHCGPWFCASSMRQPSGRRREFPGKPTGRLRFQWIRCNDAYLDVIAFGAFE
jgi:hypothetical protein